MLTHARRRTRRPGRTIFVAAISPAATTSAASTPGSRQSALAAGDVCPGPAPGHGGTVHLSERWGEDHGPAPSDGSGRAHGGGRRPLCPRRGGRGGPAGGPPTPPPPLPRP